MNERIMAVIRMIKMELRRVVVDVLVRSENTNLLKELDAADADVGVPLREERLEEYPS